MSSESVTKVKHFQSITWMEVVCRCKVWMPLKYEKALSAIASYSPAFNEQFEENKKKHHTKDEKIEQSFIK